ncbi:MAG: antitoxin family protein [Phycisphaeraceae bacterium]|nr:MAG: antitoxin family protein [Phycisphaeraceae bacterium]
MVQIVRAIYEGGVLRPEERLDLAEHQRVRVTVERLESTSSEQRTAALQEPFRLAGSMGWPPSTHLSTDRQRSR